MKEIEVKASVNNASVLREKLKSAGWQPLETAVQDDRVYIKNGIDYSAIPPGTIFLRLREQLGRKTFTFKQRLKKEDELQCLEYESVIENPEAISDMLKALDFYEVVRVKKSREAARLHDMEICLDDVEGLGTFIEVERMVDDESTGDQVQEELVAFLETLGISKTDRVTVGYDTLVYRSTH